MKKEEKKNIALMAGGNSGEYEISIQSAKQIEENIDKEKYNIYKIILRGRDWYYEKSGIKTHVNKDDFSMILGGRKIRFDAAFIIIHGTPGENGLLQGYFEMMEIPFCSSSSLVSSITFDKVVCNSVVKDLGIVNIAQNLSYFKNEEINHKEIIDKLSLPLFVKPAQGGSSLGMTLVKKEEELEGAIEKAFVEHDRVIIEEYIKGRELTSGVLKTNNEIIAFPITEIISKNEFFDYDAKYLGFSDEITPAKIEDEIRDLVQETSKKLYKALNCRGVIRADYIYDTEKKKLFFLEINTIPGQSQASIVPQQVREMGWSTKDLYNRILDEVFIK